MATSRAEIERLKGVVERGGIANDQIILDIASTLLRVEDRLDQQLLRLTIPQDTDGRGSAAEPGGQDEEFRQVAESVMRECIINLARIKETISQSIAAEAPSQGLDSVPTLIRGIKAALLMLGKPRAMEVVEGIGSLVTAMLNSGGPAQLTQRETDRLADAIVSIEYYMETVKAGRSEPWYMLDNAEACLVVLRDVEQRMLQAIPEDGVQTGQTMKMSAAAIQAEAERALLAERQVMPETTVIPLPVVAPDAEHLDPELLELFIEEAKEEIASIKRNLPLWASSPDDMETLITARRSFHTLKGSGRMVGAERMGEYCWSVESLLNRLINRTLARTPPMVDFILRAAAAVPELVEQLEIGTQPRADINLLMARANAFAEGDPDAAVLTIRQPDTEVPPKVERALEMDPVLYDIFSKETAGHLKVITDYLSACEGYDPPFDVTDKLHRACHTLHGSANMANVDRGVAVASALNRFVRRVYDHKVGFQRAGLAALQEAAGAIATIVGDINNPDRERADYTALIDRIATLANAVLPGKTPARKPEAAPTLVAPPRPVTEVITTEPEYDAEIASIFTEESAELLESADKVLIRWVRERSAQPMEELKRHLHTLKGGARMAGITAMGDLSHELETLLTSINDGRVKATPAIEDLLQRSIDELHRMRDMVIAGKPVKAAIGLVQRIQQANAGFEVADDAEIEVSPDDTSVQEAPPVAFTVEPEDTVSMVIVDSQLADELAEIGKQKKDEPPLVQPPAPEPELELTPETEAEPELELEPEAAPEPEP